MSAKTARVYVRLGERDSSVGVYRKDDGVRVCLGCRISGGRGFFASRIPLEMAEHLAAHQLAGDTVPEGVITDVLEDGAVGGEGSADDQSAG